MPRILMVASEAAPFAKTGGLADVMGSLPAALARLGNDVAVLLPRYRNIVIAPGDRVYENLSVNVGPRRFSVGIDQVVRQGVRYFFVDCPTLYDRAGIYNEAGVDYPDNHIRFAVLSQAAIEVARHLFLPDVFHAHDWQAGLLPVLLRENLAGDPTFFGSRCMLTIHNLGYQGNFPSSALADLDLDPSLFHTEGLEFYGRVSFLKAGIVWANAVTTVSPTYAREIQTPEFGFGMDGLLRSRAGKLSGILNGVDYQEWNPETDRHLTANYSVRDLSGKRAAKLALLDEMGIERDPDRPLIGIVSRFAYQKGMDLVAEIAPELVGENVAMATLGSGDAPVEAAFLAMAASRPDRFAIRIGYDDRLAHRIEAGSDIFLMPSRYEPCGLNQIYSLRYGTVPVVHATGGLDDTVAEETGFKFSGLTAGNLAAAIREALAAFADRKAWVTRMRLGMAKNFSWDASAAQYQELYRSRI
jgi:starch synthase